MNWIQRIPLPIRLLMSISIIGVVLTLLSFVAGIIARWAALLFMYGWAALSVCLCVVLMSSCSLTVPVTATGNPMGSKTGHASAVTVLGICINGDASVETAALSGGIDRITTVDFKTQNFLWIVKRHTCLVRGN